MVPASLPNVSMAWHINAKLQVTRKVSMPQSRQQEMVAQMDAESMRFVVKGEGADNRSRGMHFKNLRQFLEIVPNYCADN